MDLDAADNDTLIIPTAGGFYSRVTVTSSAGAGGFILVGGESYRYPEGCKARTIVGRLPASAGVAFKVDAGGAGIDDIYADVDIALA